MLPVILILLFVLIALFTAMQTFYLEGMRLQARELASLQYFKTELEPKLSMRSEEGALTFSLWKHSCLVVFGILSLAEAIDGQPMSVPELLQAIAAALLA